MSTRSERRRQERSQSEAPKSRGGLIAAIVLGVAMIAIVAYAIVERDVLVNGAAVDPNALPSLPPPLKEGTVAPGFSVVAGGVALSSASFAGKPYLLELFATWCPHCQRMTSVLRDIRRAFPPAVLGMVSVTGSPLGSASTSDHLVAESQADVDAFDAQYGVTWPTAFDKDLTVAKTWGLVGFPGIFVVDKRGIIVFASGGEIDEKTLVSAIKKAGG